MDNRRAIEPMACMSFCMNDVDRLETLLVVAGAVEFDPLRVKLRTMRQALVRQAAASVAALAP